MEESPETLNAFLNDPDFNQILESFNEWADIPTGDDEWERIIKEDPRFRVRLLAAYAIDLNCREAAGTLTGHEEFANNVTEALGVDAQQMTQIRNAHSSLIRGGGNEAIRTGYSLVSTLASTIFTALNDGREKTTDRIRKMFHSQDPTLVKEYVDNNIDTIMDLGAEVAEDPTGLTILDEWAKHNFVKYSRILPPDKTYDFAKGLILAVNDYERIRALLTKVITRKTK